MIAFSTFNLPYEKVGKNEPVCIADEVPFEIPDSWMWTRFGNIVINFDSKRKPVTKSDRKTDRGDYDYYGATGAIDRVDDYIFDGLFLMIGEDGGNFFSERDNSFIAEGKFWANNHVHVVQPICINIWYLKYFLDSCNFANMGLINGIAVPKLNQANLNSILVPVPPIDEQVRIISKISFFTPLLVEYDIKYSALDKLNAQFPEMLKKSILQQAVMGKLVPQDPNDEPASVLLERIRAEKQALIKSGKLKKDKHESIIYRRDNSHYEKVDGKETCIDEEIPFEIPSTWEWARASSLGSMIRGKGIKRTETTADGLPCVRYGEIYTSYNILFTEAQSHISESLDKTCNHFSEGDLVFTLTGENKVDIAKTVAYLGKSDVAAGGDLAYWTAHGMNPLYLVYFMACPYCIERKRRTATGDIIVHISTDKVGSFLVPIPPLAEQDRIVASINRAFSKVSAL